MLPSIECPGRSQKIQSENPGRNGEVPSGNDCYSLRHWKWPSRNSYNSWFTHSKWWFSTAMLVYQRVSILGGWQKVANELMKFHLSDLLDDFVHSTTFYCKSMCCSFFWFSFMPHYIPLYYIPSISPFYLITSPLLLGNARYIPLNPHYW